VPTYNPTVVYGAWPYPAYPPYYYYPPGYVAGSMFWFGASMAMGAAMGAAWGYGWGNCDWNGGNVKIDNSRNNNFNNKIDRGKYANQLPSGGRGNWQHNAEHRKGVSYRDQGTAQKFNRASTNDQIKSREQFRGRADQGRQDLGRGGASDRAGPAGDRGLGGSQGAGGNRGGAGDRASVSNRASGGAGGSSFDRGGSSSRGGAFSGAGGSGSSARSASSRGSASRGGGGGGRGGGGGGGGGGRRR